MSSNLAGCTIFQKYQMQSKSGISNCRFDAAFLFHFFTAVSPPIFLSGVALRFSAAPAMLTHTSLRSCRISPGVPFFKNIKCNQKTAFQIVDLMPLFFTLILACSDLPFLRTLAQSCTSSTRPRICLEKTRHSGAIISVKRVGGMALPPQKCGGTQRLAAYA